MNLAALAALSPHRKQERQQRVDCRVQPSLNLHIILPEDISTAESSQEPPVRHGGDEISGHLEVMTYGNFQFEIDVSFEGLVRTWIGTENNGNLSHLPPTAELQFMQETQKVFSDPSTRYYKGYLGIYRLPFRFVVPHELISARSDVHSDFLKPCPSTRQGLSFWGPTTRKTYRQPMIIYLIRIKRIRTDIPVESLLRPTYQREIIVMPYTPAAPPLVIEAFPREYKSLITKALKRHRWRHSLGTLKISAAEPSPLNILALAPRLSTFVALSLVFTPDYPGGFDVRPHEWNYVVKYHLRNRTFYSTRRLEQMPTLAAAKADPFLGIREKKTASEVREYGKISWNRDRQPQLLEQDESPDQRETCPWMAALMVPINATKMLLPTFLNPLSARQYALVLGLSVKELYHEAIELILPVQVICYPPNVPGFGIDDGERSESQDGVSASLSPFPHNFMTLEVGVHSLFQTYDASPPPYDL